jgi:hypothetical protein
MAQDTLHQPDALALPYDVRDDPYAYAAQDVWDDERLAQSCDHCLDQIIAHDSGE